MRRERAVPVTVATMLVAGVATLASIGPAAGVGRPAAPLPAVHVSSPGSAGTARQAGPSTVPLAAPRPAASPALGRAAASPGRWVHRDFPAQGDCNSQFCWTPGEPAIAVGPTDIVETVNTTATVFSKATGAQLAFFDFATFWGTPDDRCVDPRALYMPGDDRFAISCTDITPGIQSVVHFAISKTGDPTQGWWQYAANPGFPAGNGFLDQDKIEATADQFVVAGNAGDEYFFVYNKSDVLDGVANPPVVQVLGVQSELYMSAVQQTYSPNAYFVSTYPGSSSMWLATITGTPAAGDVAIAETALPGPAYAAPQEPQVPGGSIGDGDLDGRIYDAVYEQETSDNKPVIEYSTAGECGNQTCIVDGRIDLSGPTPVKAYETLIGQPGWDYSYGAVGLNAAGVPIESYTKSNPTTQPEAAVYGNGFDVVIQPSTPGTTSCDTGQTPPCDERWGDYVSAAIDPSDPTSVWVSGLYQQGDGGYNWGTIIAKVSPATGVAPTIITGTSSNVLGTTATVSGTVDPNGSATTSYFEYGTTTSYGSQTAAANDGAGSAPVSVSAGLTGLVPGTTYHYRLDATNGVGTNFGQDGTFTTLPPPTVTTGSASAVTGATASLSGTIDPQGQATTWAFEYGTTTAYGSTSTGGTTDAGTQSVGVSVNLAGLAPGTTYHYQLVGTNPSGTVGGGDKTFATLSLPEATTSKATRVGATTATLEGTVKPKQQDTTWMFQWGLTTAYGNTTTGGSVAGRASMASVSNPLSGLAPNTPYHYRLVATNGTGTTDGNDFTFATLPPPAVTTQPASSVTPSTAHLNGDVNPKGQPTTWHFDWGLTAAYGSTTAPGTTGSGKTGQPVGAPISGLQPGTTYHFRLSATSASGTSLGTDHTFTTPPPPKVTTGAATVSGTSVTLAGTVNPEGVSTKYWFEYGPTTAYGHQTASTSAGSGKSSTPVTTTIATLKAGTWHYRVVAKSTAGTTDGSDRTFVIP